MLQVAIITMDMVQLVHYPYANQYRIFFKQTWRQIEAITKDFMVADVGMVNIPPRIFMYIKTNMGLYCLIYVTNVEAYLSNYKKWEVRI